VTTRCQIIAQPSARDLHTGSCSPSNRQPGVHHQRCDVTRQSRADIQVPVSYARGRERKRALLTLQGVLS
jgi:hypothetical protein